MIRTAVFLALFAIFSLLHGGAHAQPQRVSPHETVSPTIDGAKINITWGTDYSQGTDLARIDMQVGSTSMPVEQLTIVLNDTQAGGDLTLRWERTEAKVAFSIVN